MPLTTRGCSEGMTKVRVQDVTKELSANTGKMLESVTRMRKQSQDMLNSLRKISEGFVREERERQEREAKEELSKQYAASASFMTAYSSEQVPDIPAAPVVEEKPAEPVKPAPEAKPQAAVKPDAPAQDRRAPQQQPQRQPGARPATPGQQGQRPAGGQGNGDRDQKRDSTVITVNQRDQKRNSQQRGLQQNDAPGQREDHFPVHSSLPYFRMSARAARRWLAEMTTTLSPDRI